MVEGEQIGQEQIHDLIFKESVSWQSIIYDLINSGQLDPWNIDLTLLSQRYLERVRSLEEANFFISSKVLLAASLLLRLKSDIVLRDDLPTLDEILFGKKEEKKSIIERIELEDEVPELVMRTPLPRFRRVTLEELMGALNKAISTETRRIKRVLLVKQQEFETAHVLPKRSVQLQDHIAAIYRKLRSVFEDRTDRLAFTHLLGDDHDDREKKIMGFVSLLHLDNQQRVWLEQEGHFDEIWIWLKELYVEKHKDRLESLRAEVEAFMKEAEQSQEESDASFGEPIEADEDVASVKNEITHEDEES